MQGAKKTMKKKKTEPDAVSLTEHIGAVCPRGRGKAHVLCATGMLSRLRRGELQGSAPWSTKHI